MYQKVLVPLDGSELAESVLPHVIAMVKEGFVKEIIVLNITDINIPYGDIGAIPNFVEYHDSQVNLFRKYLDDIESQLLSEGIKVKSETIVGHRPAQTIIDFSRQKGVNLIVMATHGYTGVRKMLLGSVALKVLHESHIPVLLVRPEAARK
jgi:nucleotide-binding universal stress UspA family protein